MQCPDTYVLLGITPIERILPTRKLERKKGDKTMIADGTIIKDSTSEETKKQLVALFRRLVPWEGKADTVAGEIVRAVNCIAYHFDNDGSMMGYVYSEDTVNRPGRYLMKRCSATVKDAVMDAWALYSQHGYEEKLEILEAEVLEYLKEHPELEHTKNTEDIQDFIGEDEVLVLDRAENGVVIQYRENGELITKYIADWEF